MFQHFVNRVKKTLALGAAFLSAANLPLYAANLTIHVQDGSGTSLQNASVYGMVYGTRGPDGTESKAGTTDASGNVTFSLNPAKDYTFIASAQGKGPLARTQMMSSSAPHYRGDTTAGTATIRLNQDLTGRGKIHLTVQHGTANSFIMANVHKEGTNADVQVGGCAIDNLGSDCTIDLHNIPEAAADTYNVGVFDPNLFSGSGGGVGQRIGSAITSGGTVNVTLDLNNAFPPSVSSTGNLQPDANNAVISVSLRSNNHPDVTIPRAWIQIMSKDQNGNLFPNGGGQTDDAGIVQFRMGTGSYYVQTGFACVQSTNKCYDGIQPDPANAADVTIANGDLNTRVNKTKLVPETPAGTGAFTVEVVKASNHAVKIPYANLNLGPDWSQWRASASGAPHCDGTDGGNVSSNPGKTQINQQANDGSASFTQIPNGNYMLQAWAPFAQGGVPFNAGPDNVFNWGNGIRGCDDQIDDSADDLRLTINGAQVKVFNVNGADVSNTYVDTSGLVPKIQIPFTTTADNADGLVHGTLTFPEANNATVSITLYGECDQNGCPGNFTTVQAGGQASVPYSLHVPSTHNSNPANYWIQIKSDTYGPVFANGEASQIRFVEGSADVTQNFKMAKSGIVQGTLYNPDGSVFIQKNEPNSPHANINISGEHSWANADVRQDGSWRAVSVLPGKYKIDIQMWGGSTTMTGKRPQTQITVAAGETVQARADLVNAEFLFPVWDVSAMPTLINQSFPGRGIRGETYNILLRKAGEPLNGDALRQLLVHNDNDATIDYIPDASVNNRCGNGYVGWCGNYQPDGYTSDVLAVRQGSLERVSNRNFYPYMVFLQKQERVAIDSSKTSNPTINVSGSSIKPIRVNFSPEYTSNTVTISGTVKASQMFRAIDFEKMGGDFDKFLLYIPLVSVLRANGQVAAAGLVTPSAEHVGDGAPDGNLIDQTIASGDFAAFKNLIKDWDWNFEIRGVPKADRYLLSLTSPNYPALSKSISGQSDYFWNVDWDKDGSAGGTVSGTITDGSGTGLASATVELRKRNLTKSVTTASDGTFKFEGLPAGNYKLTASAADHISLAKRVRVTGTAVETANLALDSSDGSLSGTVYRYASASGAVLKVAASGVKVTAYDGTYAANHAGEALAVYQTETADDGTFSLTGLKSGEVYKLAFILSGYYVENLSVTAIVGNSSGNDVTLRAKGLEIKTQVKHDDENNRYVLSILNPDNFDSGSVWIYPASQTFDSNSATDISSSMDEQPDHSLIGFINDSTLGGVAHRVHIVGVPADGSQNVTSDFALVARVDQPIAELLSAGDGDNAVDGPNNSGITFDAGALLPGNDDSTSAAAGIAVLDQSDFDTTVQDGGTVQGDPVQITFTNTQSNPDSTIDISIPVDGESLGDNDPANMELLIGDGNGGWTASTLPGGSYDPVTQTFTAPIDPSTVVTQLPLTSSLGKQAVSVAAAERRPVTMAAIKTTKEIKKNPHAAASVAGIFAVGMLSSGGVTSTSGYHQYNFPNPFNLKDKTVALRAGTSGIPTSIRGTYIVVAPTGSGTVPITVRIFNVAGDMVREFKDSATAGSYNYIHWDGKNTAGDDVASGVYFAAVDVPGAPKKEPVKMVVVK